MYDGQTIHYFGDCKYLLTKYVTKHGNCSFEVTVQNEFKGMHSKLTCTKIVFIQMFNDIYAIEAGIGLKLNGVQKSIPYEKGVEVRVFNSGNLIQFVAPKCGVNIAFDGNCNVFVEVASNYRGKMTGLCGNCNGLKDDFRTEDGKDVSHYPNKFNLIGDSYAISNDERPCTPAKPFDIEHVCNGDWKEKIKNINQCGSLLGKEGPFIHCSKSDKISMKDFYEDCKIDVCSNINNPKRMENARCNILKGVSEICAEIGFPGIKWRTKLNCALKCHVNEHFSTKINPCPRTCENHFFGSINPCYHLPEREGCECNNGFIRDGSLCVRPSQCKCIDLCVDRIKLTKCLEWKNQNRCQKYPGEMNKLCSKTCGFCKGKFSECQDELQTWKCLQFRDEGKCVSDFYKTICGLTCNYEKCACAKDKKIIGPCDQMEKKQTITFYHYIRNDHGRCIKTVTQITKVCDCPFVYITRRGLCNYCTGKIVLSIFIQKEVNGNCIRRHINRYILCSHCFANPKKIRSCLHNKLLIETTLFNKRIGCYKCVSSQKVKSTLITCKSSVIVGRCNHKTCIKTNTYIKRRAINCKCVEERYYKSFKCCCEKIDRNIKPFCVNGKIIHRRITYKFISGFCKPFFKDRVEIRHCQNPRNIRGRCQQYKHGKLYCIAEDKHFFTRLNRKCQCITRHCKHYRTCCCKKAENYKTCDKERGIIEYVKIEYSLVKNGHKYFCVKKEKRRTKTINFPTQYIRKEGKCLANCIKTDIIIKKYRSHCKIKEAFERIETKLCCCLPRSRTEIICVADYIIVTLLYKRIIVGCQCMEFLESRKKRIVTCPESKVERSECIYPGYKRLVTRTFYISVKCKCEKKQEFYKEQCRPCPYKIYKVITTPCNKRSCLQKVITYFQDVDCKYKVRRCDELCCCKDKPWKRSYCDCNTGITYTTNYWYVFIPKTQKCCEMSNQTSNRVFCILSIQVTTGKCGEERKYYKKRTVKRYVLNKETCSCKPIFKIKWIICKCPHPKKFKWRCVGQRLIRKVITYTMNACDNICSAKKYEELKYIICPRPRHDQEVPINRCKFAIYKYFYKIINCKCFLKRKRNVYVKCCLKHQHVTKKCQNQNNIETSVTYYKVSTDRKKCIKVVSVSNELIICVDYFQHKQTLCIKGRYFDITIHYGVKDCACGKISVKRVPKICECIPNVPVIKTICMGSKWRKTITKLELHDGRCIPVSKYYDAYIDCAHSVSTKKPCDHNTGFIIVRTVFNIVRHCKCVPFVKYHKIKCLCWRPDRIVRPRCISTTRIVRTERYKEINGHCIWTVIETEVEDCKCPKTISIRKCYKNYLIHTIKTFYIMVYVQLKILVQRCHKKIRQSYSPFSCNKNYEYKTPCKNFQQSIISCTFNKVNCKCQEYCKVKCVQACDCKQNNYCKVKCIKNVKYNICYKFYENCSKCSPHCIKAKSKKVIPAGCSPPFVGIICTPCNIYKNNGFYKKCTRFFVVYENCQCKIKEEITKVLCHCRNKWVAKPFCKNNHFVVISTFYIVKHGQCYPKTWIFTKKVVCPKSYITTRIRRCVTEYILTYYRKRNCHCIKRHLIKTSRTCCYRTTIDKFCRRNKWVFIKNRYVLRSSDIRLFPNIPNSPIGTVCQRVTTEWTKPICCPSHYVVKWCNTVTLQLRIENHIFYNINCVCKKKVRITYESCKKCPKKIIHRSECHAPGQSGIGYIDVTVTFYKITKKNHCKMYVKHKKEVCSCPKYYENTFCKNGQLISMIITYSLHSHPPCTKQVYITSKAICCFNHGKPNLWRLIKIKTCKKPGQYTIWYYERYLFNKVTCGCKRVTKSVKKGICCQPCRESRRCVRNYWLYTKVCQHSKHFICVPKQTSRIVRIKCPKPVKHMIKPCIRGFWKYSLTTYNIVRCHCVKKTVIKVERCKCFPITIKICDGHRWKVITTTFKLIEGHCIPKQMITYQNIFCIKIVTFKDYPIDKCTFWRYYFNKIVKHCACVDHFMYKEKLNYKCCQRERILTSCKKNNIVVTTRYYFILVQFRCLQRTCKTKRIIDCNHIALKKEIKIGLCLIKYIHYKVQHKRCTCHRQKVREEIKETCCDHKKPYKKVICEKRKGLIITYYYTYHLDENFHCQKCVKTSSVAVHCNRKMCHTVIGDCINNTRIVKLYCKKRKHCVCVMKLVHQCYQCCTPKDFKSIVVGPCIEYFKTITYYAFVLNKETNQCHSVIIREQKLRCRCPKGHVYKSCVQDIFIKIITVTYLLNQGKDSCILIKDVKMHTIKYCEKKKRLLGIVKQTCNPKSGWGTVTYEYIHAQNCHCIKTRKVKKVICCCDTAYPPKHKTYCKDNKIIVKETSTASCKGDHVIYITSIQETPITNCDKIVKEKTCCYLENDGYAISIRYISTIRYITRNCKCYRKVIKRVKRHCKCRKPWIERKCYVSRKVIIIHTYKIIRGICKMFTRSIIQHIPCPSQPQVTRTKCKNNKYKIITQIFYHQNCKCSSRFTEKQCDCFCPRKVMKYKCTHHFLIEISIIVWKKMNCICRRFVTVSQKVPKCPSYQKETIGDCIRNGAIGFRNIITRVAEQSAYTCKCKIIESSRSEVCWCSEKIHHRKHCYRNNILVKEKWKSIINKYTNSCKKIKIYFHSVTIVAPNNSKIYTCNKKTGREKETIISYTVKDCRIIKHVKVNYHRCKCTKKWKLIKRGKCSGPPRCLRSDIYIRQELRNKNCIKIKVFIFVKCCCYPAKNIYNYCKDNKKYTLTTNFVLKNDICVPSENRTFSSVACPLIVKTKETKCNKYGYKIIRRYIYVARHCKCVLKKIAEFNCRCWCNKTKTEYHCIKKKGIKTKTVTSHSLIKCKCITKSISKEIQIKCPRKIVFVSKCLPVKGKVYYITTTIIKSYHINSRCLCVPKKITKIRICRCKRNKKKRTWCDKINHVITEEIIYTVLMYNRCVTKIHRKKHFVNCKPNQWLLEGDSGCILNNKYGERILTYFRQIAVGCTCKKERKIVKCDCRCTGPSRKSSCYVDRIKHIYYHYKMVNCKCIRTETVKWELIYCKNLLPIKEKCREVSKDVFMEYIIYRYRFVLNCKCKTIISRLGKVCRCPNGFTTKRCNHLTNMYEYTRTWFDLLSYGCKRQTETVIKCTHCDLTSDCHVISPCRKGSHTQRYECIERYRENCKCHKHKRQYVQRCECKPKKITQRHCNKLTCFRQIIITKFNLIILKNNKRKCIPSQKIKRERCCCHKKPLKHVECKNNKLILTKTSFYFNKRTKECEKTFSAIDNTPECCPARKLLQSKCNTHTCIQHVIIVTKSLVNCHCIIKRIKKSRECCCKEKDYTTTVCIRGNIFKTTFHWHRFINGHCKTYTNDIYKRVSCPPPKVRFGHCRKTTLTQVKKTTKYYLRNCHCYPRTIIQEIICACPPPFTTSNCVEATGIQQTIYSYYVLNVRCHKCYKFQRIISIPTKCNNKRITCTKECRVSYHNGEYKTCITRYDVRIGCKCCHRSYRYYVLCYCPRPHRFNICKNNIKMTKEIYYHKVSSTKKYYNYVCVKKIRTLSKIIIDCMKPRITKSQCINNVVIYTLVYYKLENCVCVRHIKIFKVICGCDRPKLINKTCVDDVRKERTIRYHRLICDKKSIPTCKCVPFEQLQVKNVLCKKPDFKVENCKGDRKDIVSIHYEPKNCKCHEVKYITKIDCIETCYDMPQCPQIKQLGLCTEPVYYQFECQLTCGYCERCPEDHVVKYVGESKSTIIAGILICTRETVVMHYFVVDRKCHSRTYIYHSLCHCLNKYPLKKCLYLKEKGRCKEMAIMRHCEYTCNPNCHILCQGQIKHRKCVQRGEHKGTYKVVVLTFKSLAEICLVDIKITYQGKCQICNKFHRKKITPCIGNKRYVLTYYVIKVHGVCVNKVSRTAYSCKDCCDSTEIKIGNCIRNIRTVVTIFWTNKNHYCKKQTFTNIYPCNKKCLGITYVTSRCILNKRIEFKVWKSGPNCDSYSSYNVVSCVPVAL